MILVGCDLHSQKQEVARAPHPRAHTAAAAPCYSLRRKL